MKVSQFDAYNSSSQWLRHSDLHGPTNVTIEEVTTSRFDDKETGQAKDQIVLAFQGFEKRLGLNKTNALRIAQLLGDETDLWVGQTITLYVEQNVKGPNGTGPAVRVMPMLPGVAQQRPARPPVPHTAVGNAVRGVVQRQGRPTPPPQQQYVGPEEEYDPLG